MYEVSENLACGAVSSICNGICGLICSRDRTLRLSLSLCVSATLLIADRAECVESDLLDALAERHHVNSARADAMEHIDREVNQHFPARMRNELRQRLTNLVDRPLRNNAGSILSGSAPNELLDVLAESALYHEKLIADQRAWAPNRSASTDDFLHTLDRSLEIPTAMLEQLQLEQGLRAPLLPIRLSVGDTVLVDALPLNWPDLMHETPALRRMTERVEACKRRFLNARSAETRRMCARDLRKSFTDLAGETERQKNRFFCGARSIGKFSRANRSLKLGDFVENARNALERFLEFQTEALVAYQRLRESSPGNVSVISLIAFLSEREIWFAPIGNAGEHARVAVFKAIAKYYRSLRHIQEASRQLREMVESEAAALFQAAQGERIDARLEQINKAIQGLTRLKPEQAAVLPTLNIINQNAINSDRTSVSVPGSMAQQLKRTELQE